MNEYFFDKNFFISSFKLFSILINNKKKESILLKIEIIFLVIYSKNLKKIL
ncbi:hypothetical protein M8044_000399 [Columbia Basin potato purple top phytoplasma]|uniref:Uncharacterized protein n=1 Tax=Columbia Basin potato purple top phytoplasma TaxID=307134 RepID=A0ABT5LC16_9MOLU|nr:hypothetical protein [Columbia Basin potato purple top phytoplasma]